MPLKWYCSNYTNVVNRSVFNFQVYHWNFVYKINNRKLGNKRKIASWFVVIIQLWFTFLSFGHETVMYHPLTMVAFNVMFVWHNNRKLFQVPFSHAWWKSFIPTLLLCCIYYNCPLLFYFSSILFDYFCSKVACSGF